MDGGTSWDIATHSAELFPSQQRNLGERLLQDLMNDARWRCIWVCSMHAHSFAMLLAQEHDADTWKRAGMFRIYCTSIQMRPLVKDEKASWFDVEWRSLP